jgi:hypothetical protein
MRARLLTLVTAFTVALPAVAGYVYDAVVAGKSCKKTSVDGDVSECSYRVGKSLHFTIFGIGYKGPESGHQGVVFEKSDIDGDFYAGYDPKSGCIFVAPGSGEARARPAALAGARSHPQIALSSLPEITWVSIKNGNVYRDDNECRLAK